MLTETNAGGVSPSDAALVSVANSCKEEPRSKNSHATTRTSHCP